MLNRLNHRILPGSSRRRGGTFFTMLIFIMMLVSTALMYYYFQRTRELQREIVALKSGMGLAAEEESGFWDWLPWGKADGDEDAEDTAEPAPAAAVAVQATPQPVVTTPVATEDFAQPSDAELPPPGAASTPRPVNAAVPEGNPPVQALDLNRQTEPATAEEPQVLEPIDATQSAEGSPEGEAAAEPDAETAQPEDAPSGESGPREPIQSMYDQLPPVRVRSPRQNQ